MKQAEERESDKQVIEAVETVLKKLLIEMLTGQKKQERQKIIYNTRMLMESYIEMRKHIENAISEAEELEVEEFQIFKTGNSHLESVRRSKLKTAMMLANIDRAMEELKEEQAKKETLYKYEAFELHYIDGASFEDVAEALNCGKNTPARWCKDMMKIMSVKLFGVDGIEKW